MEKKYDAYAMYDHEGFWIATDDSKEELEKLKNKMLFSGSFEKWKVKKFVIIENKQV